MTVVPRHRAWFRTGALAAASAGLALVLVGCSEDSGDSAEPDSGTSPTEEVSPTDEPLREGSDEEREGVDVTREEAEAAALAAVGEGRVTWSGPEDDRGAAWEIEVTRPDGTEVDVLVAADGSIVGQIDKLGEDDVVDPGPPEGASDPVTRGQAEAAALAAVGEGRVTWSGREDERGAMWEIEVTRPDGTEIDVLIDAQGRVVP
jgi:uncharacterized membrane protein YkoI